MTREDIIHRLKQIAPIITQVTGTTDMGFEFSAVVPSGLIYAEPGMLLSYSGGEWPPLQWEDLSDEELEQWLEDVNNTQSSDEDDGSPDVDK